MKLDIFMKAVLFRKLLECEYVVLEHITIGYVDFVVWMWPEVACVTLLVHLTRSKMPGYIAVRFCNWRTGEREEER